MDGGSRSLPVEAPIGRGTVPGSVGLRRIVPVGLGGGV